MTFSWFFIGKPVIKGMRDRGHANEINAIVNYVSRPAIGFCRLLNGGMSCENFSSSFLNIYQS